MIHMSRQILHSLLAICLLQVVLVGCKPKRPAGILSPADMENLLVDYHLAQGMAQASNAGKEDELRYIYIRAALRKHHVEEAVFDSSIVYYSKNSEQMAIIYDHVRNRLEALAGSGQNESQSGNASKYANLTNQGDTASVWEGTRQAVLTQDILNNLLTLTWQADTAVRKGDSYIWHCVTQKVAQGSLPNTYAQMIIRYENDTTVSTTTRILGDQELELYWQPYPPLDSIKAKTVTLMVYMSSEDIGGDNQQQRRQQALALLLRDISLIRIHAKKTEPLQKADSVALKQDTLQQSDTTHAAERVPEASPNRLTPAQLRDAHPHAATIQVRKERPGHPFAPARPVRNNRNRRR